MALARLLLSSALLLDSVNCWSISKGSSTFEERTFALLTLAGGLSRAVRPSSCYSVDLLLLLDLLIANSRLSIFLEATCPLILSLDSLKYCFLVFSRKFSPDLASCWFEFLAISGLFWKLYSWVRLEIVFLNSWIFYFAVGRFAPCFTSFLLLNGDNLNFWLNLDTFVKFDFLTFLTDDTFLGENMISPCCLAESMIFLRLMLFLDFLFFLNFLRFSAGSVL